MPAYYDRIRAEGETRLSRTTSTRSGAGPAVNDSLETNKVYLGAVVGPCRVGACDINRGAK